MRGSIITGFLFILAAILATNSTHAAPVSFTIDPVTFDDGGMVTGSFDFDFANFFDPYSNINITTTPGTAFAGFTYTDYTTDVTGPFILIAVSDIAGDPGDFGLALFFDPQLNPLGGIASIAMAEEAECTVGPLCQEANVLRSFGATVVPVPATVWLFGSALGLLGWIRRQAA